jgi:hypothetical protein
MVSKVDWTVDSRDFKKTIATVATSRQSIFRGFCYGIFIGFQWENGRILSKWPQNLQKFPSKSTVDLYVADPRSCNSWLFSRKYTILSTMVSKVDHTVDYGFKSRLYCRLLKKQSDDCRLLKKKSCNSRFNIVKSRLSTLMLAHSKKRRTFLLFFKRNIFNCVTIVQVQTTRLNIFQGFHMQISCFQNICCMWNVVSVLTWYLTVRPQY